MRNARITERLGKWSSIEHEAYCSHGNQPSWNCGGRQVILAILGNREGNEDRDEASEVAQQKNFLAFMCMYLETKTYTTFKRFCMHGFSIIVWIQRISGTNDRAQGRAHVGIKPSLYRRALTSRN